MDFKSKEELYERIKPALYSRSLDFKRMGVSYIKEQDIWNYLVSYVWNKKHNLTLNDVVGDIMNLDVKDIKDYLFKMLRENDREIITDEGELL